MQTKQKTGCGRLFFFLYVFIIPAVSTSTAGRPYRNGTRTGPYHQGRRRRPGLVRPAMSPAGCPGPARPPADDMRRGNGNADQVRPAAGGPWTGPGPGPGHGSTETRRKLDADQRTAAGPIQTDLIGIRPGQGPRVLRTPDPESRGSGEPEKRLVSGGLFSAPSLRW